MTIEQCYEAIGGSYQKVCSRLPGRKFVERFLLRYLKDDSAQLLMAAVDAGDVEETFRYALALKGVAANLGFGDLENAVAELAETIHNAGSITPGARRLAQEVQRCHTHVVKTIRCYLENGQY